MDNINFFLMTGEYVFIIIIKFFGIAPASIPLGTVKVLSFLLALILWAWIFRMIIAILQRLLGIEPRGGRRW